MPFLLDAEEHHWWFTGRRLVLRAELQRLTLPTPADVLDAGCGTGRNLVEFARLGPVAGIDLSRQSVPDATTLLKFRRLLQDNDLTRALFDEINAHLAAGTADAGAHHRRRDDHQRPEFDEERFAEP